MHVEALVRLMFAELLMPLVQVDVMLENYFKINKCMSLIN